MLINVKWQSQYNSTQSVNWSAIWSTVRSLGNLKDEFDVVKLQVAENIGLNDEKFKMIDKQMAKGANDRKGRIVGPQDLPLVHVEVLRLRGRA